MQLTGSKTEDDFRQELLKSKQWLFSDGYLLLQELRKINQKLLTAYVLHTVPDHEENLYTVLVNNELIVEISLNNILKESKEIRKLLSVAEYKKKLQKWKQIKLAVALDLVNKDLEPEPRKN